MKVAVTGATGFVGSRLVERLREEKVQVLLFTRDPGAAGRLFPPEIFTNVEILAYSPTQSGTWQDKISGCDGVVNLAGEPIAERWTETRKQEIIQSRQLGTQRLVEAIIQANPRPQVLISASAIGYYGTSETDIFDEASPPGTDFLAQVCQAWEAEAKQVTATDTRLVILRLGIVLGMGGVIAKLLMPFKLFAGGPIGTGRQWLSWIHREDLVNLIWFALTNPAVQGILNATTPNPVQMAEFCQTLGQVMNRPSWLPIPSFALEALLADGAKVVLEGQRVLPQRTLACGFEYQYPIVKQAIEEILSQN